MRLESACGSEAAGFIRGDGVTKWAVCANCGKEFLVPHCGGWQYKRIDKRKKAETFGKVIYFCSDGCETQWKQDNNIKEIAKGFRNG